MDFLVCQNKECFLFNKKMETEINDRKCKECGQDGPLIINASCSDGIKVSDEVSFDRIKNYIREQFLNKPVISHVVSFLTKVGILVSRIC